MTLQPDGIYTQLGIRPGEWDAQNSLGILDTNRSYNSGQKTRPRDNQQQKKKKKRKRKESDKYSDLGRKLKKLMEQEGDGDTHYNWCIRSDHQKT